MINRWNLEEWSLRALVKITLRPLKTKSQDIQ